MKMKVLSSLALSGMLMVFTGCVGTVDGHSTAAMPMVKDKIIRRYDRPVAQVATATKEVLSQEGNKLLAYETIGNSFVAKVNSTSGTCKVWVKLTEVEPKLTEVTVQVRSKMGASNIDLSSELSTRIALQLATTP